MDASAGSKVLISTRMKALLIHGHQVEVGLPSPTDSIRMLLAAADVNVATLLTSRGTKATVRRIAV